MKKSEGSAAGMTHYQTAGRGGKHQQARRMQQAQGWPAIAMPRAYRPTTHARRLPSDQAPGQDAQAGGGPSTQHQAEALLGDSLSADSSQSTMVSVMQPATSMSRLA